MLVNFFSDARLVDNYEISFSYRYSKKYELGFRDRVDPRFEVIPLRLDDEGEIVARVCQWLPWTFGIVRIAGRILLLRYWFVLTNAIRFYRIFRGRGPDIVHINNGNYPGAYSCMSATIAARLCGVRKIIYVVNNVAIPYSKPWRWFDYPFDRVVAWAVSLFITASCYAGDELKKVLQLPAAKLANLHNGIAPRPVTETRAATLSRLGIDERRLVVGVIAILEERKGHIVLLEAIRRIKESGGRAPLIIIEGEGFQRSHLEHFIREHALVDDVRMVGREDRVFNLINAVDIVVLPSISHEDFPNVVLEAMSLGKPVIGTRVAGIPEQIAHMETGLIVEPGDSDGLALALQQLDVDADLRVRLGQSAQQRFQREFSAEIAVEGYLRLYQNLLAS
ncbi:MAG: glycosyltransferase [Sulfuritalea sp.]|nr:glycosyltransferase [Sulfuritalea sp.]